MPLYDSDTGMLFIAGKVCYRLLLQLLLILMFSSFQPVFQLFQLNLVPMTERFVILIVEAGLYTGLTFSVAELIALEH